MYKKYKKLVLTSFAIFGLLFAISSCETTELEILDNPNALTPEASDVNLFLNAIQLNAASFFEAVTEEGMEVTRILHMFGPTYDNAYGPGQLNGPYGLTYSSILADARAMEPVAEAAELYSHIGIANVIEAYTISTMVDFLGNVPYSEAGLGAEFLNPKLDDGASVYAAMFTLLDKAIAEFGKTEAFFPNDLYYGGDKSKWIKLANTLKLKLYLQTRLVDAAASTAGINAIIASGNYITSSDDDWQFQYSSVDSNPDSRHPIFARNFNVPADVADYMSNSYMYYMTGQKGIIDPRARYYFYRQSLGFTTDPNEASCIVENIPSHYTGDYPFCDPGGGYWGRDHADADGIPPDGGLRTTWGLYPVGGSFDNNAGVAVSGRGIGTQGAGISPMMLASYVDFMLAEAALTLGTTGDAKTYMLAGIEKSIDKVMNFRTDLVDAAFAPDQTVVDDYVAFVSNEYDNAGDKLEVIVKEYFLALFGNGVEAYNTYRRTGKPGDLQPTKLEVSGEYQNSFLYPSNMVDRNGNIDQKADQSVRVFWAVGGPTVN